MRSGGGFLLVFVGLLMLWVAITGRLDKVIAAWHEVVSSDAASGTPSPAAGNALPALPALPTLGR